MQLLTNVRRTDDKNQIFIVCLYLTTFFRAVDNWSGYEKAIELAEDNNEDWNSLSAEDKYNYLSNAGVDNWTYYSDALSPEVDFRDISSNIIEKIFLEYEKDYAEKWKNYQKMKFKLHGIESTL